MVNKYLNPPITETLFEITFSDDTPWDPTIPGYFYEKIKTDYPNRSRKSAQELIEDGSTKKYRKIEVALLKSKDEKREIAIGNRLLGIRFLEPYSSWDEYYNIIHNSLKVLSEVTEIKGYKQLWLSYINTIKVDIDVGNLNQYFDLYPQMSPELTKVARIKDFIVGCEIPYNDFNGNCRISVVPNIEKDKQEGVMLQIFYICQQPHNVQPEKIYEWLDNAHNNARTVFEACISDNLRKIFGVSA